MKADCDSLTRGSRLPYKGVANSLISCRAPPTPPPHDAVREHVQRNWYFIAKQPAPAPHLAHPEECAALRIVLVTLHRVSRSCEQCPDRFELHLLPGTCSILMKRERKRDPGHDGSQLGRGFTSSSPRTPPARRAISRSSAAASPLVSSFRVEGRYEATWERIFKLLWRKAGPLTSSR